MFKALPDKSSGDVFKTSRFKVKPLFIGGILKEFLIVSNNGTEVFVRCRFLLLDYWIDFPRVSYSSMMEVENLMKGIETASQSNARCHSCNSVAKHICSKLLIKGGS